MSSVDNFKEYSLPELWSKVLDSLQKELAPQVYERWLKPIKPVELKDQELFLSVPDEFFKNWIIDHYGNMISLALKEPTEAPKEAPCIRPNRPRAGQSPC